MSKAAPKTEDPKKGQDLPFEKTIQMDPRFPNCNQTRHCYQSYVDYFRCQRILGPDYEPCDYFKRAFTVMCPNDWIARWNEQREAGTFPGRI